MITQELLGYIRAEFAKGKTREEIHKALISGGGWNEDDLSEAFRTIIPMQSVILPKEKLAVSPVPTFFMSGSSSLPVSQPSSSPSPAPSVSISPSLPKEPSITYAPPLTTFKPAHPFQPSPFASIAPNKSSIPSFSFSRALKFLIILIIIGGLGYGAWIYRSNLANLPRDTATLWNYLINKFSNLSVPYLNTPAPAPEKMVAENPTPPPAPAPLPPRDCGAATVVPDPKIASTYENNPVLNCIGESAASCTEAKAVFQNTLFPNIFEINQTGDTCSFKLSYGMDSALTDVTGKKLAGQAIACPINIVKGVTEDVKKATVFSAPSKASYSQYGSQIYFYGTLGVFIEANLDKNQIQNLGCKGEYIESMIASYNLKNNK